MRLSPPDLAARDALTRYLTTPASPPRRVAGPARLATRRHPLPPRRADLARKWLEQIGADAPPEVIAPAKALLARSRMAGPRTGSVRPATWEAVRACPGLSPGAAGVGRVPPRRVPAEHPRWPRRRRCSEEAAKGDGPGGAAPPPAALADLLPEGRPDPAKRLAVPDLLAAAVKGVAAPKDYDNHAPPRWPRCRPTVRTRHLDACTPTRRTSRRCRSPTPTRRSASGAASARRRAEMLGGVGRGLQKDGGDFKPKAAAAAAEYEALAGPAAGRHREGRHAPPRGRDVPLAGEPAKAVAAPPGGDPAAGAARRDRRRRGVGGSGRRADRHRRPPEDVWKAFNQAMAAAGPVSTAIRYRLARQFIDATHRRARPARPRPVRADRHAGNGRPAGPGVPRAGAGRAGLRGHAGGQLPRGGGVAAEATRARTRPARRRRSAGCSWASACSSGPACPPDRRGTRRRAATMRDEAVKLFKQVVAEADARQKKDGKLGDRDAWLRLQAGLRVLAGVPADAEAERPAGGGGRAAGPAPRARSRNSSS